jgi:aminocarboxymuconate-semialdehyde decarboxylase
MHIIDSHFHWWPRSVLEQFCKRKDFPKAEHNARGGYAYRRGAGRGNPVNSWAEWFDLDQQLEHMDRLGHRVDVVCSIGPLSVAFSDLAPEEGRDLSMQWNEEMAGVQRKYPGRLWAMPSLRRCSKAITARCI